MSLYSASEGDTLYCWVNTLTQGGSWLGRQYLGAIRIQRGKLMYKDSSGTWHQCTQLKSKDTSGTTHNCSALKVKDTGGTEHTIDLF